MNNFHDLIFNRRSIRKYTDEEISPENVKQILEAALVAPSSKSKMPCQFVVVENKSTLASLAKCKDFGAKPIEKCSLPVVVTADPLVSDVWVEDASIAAIMMQLQAQDLGLGSCWIQVQERYSEDGSSAEEYVKELLSIPPDIRVLCILSFGHKNEEREPYEQDQCKWEKIHIEKWKELE